MLDVLSRKMVGHTVLDMCFIIRIGMSKENLQTRILMLNIMTKRGNKITFRTPKSYPVLFNGDNFVANALFNYAPLLDNRFQIKTDLLSLKEAEELSNLILDVAISRLPYYGPNQRKILKTTGGKISMARITCKDGFKWI